MENNKVPVVTLLSPDKTKQEIVVRPGYSIIFNEEFVKAEGISVNFFSTQDFESSLLSRKYLGQVSSRADYPRKKWFFKLLFKYELVVPKEALLLDTERSDASYIHYSIGDVSLVNSTSGGGGDEGGGWRDWQGASINHCRIMGKRDFRALCDVAVIPSGTIYGASAPFTLEFDPVTVLMIEKYAQGLTNYSKTTKSYSRFWHTDHGLMTKLLAVGFYPSSDDTEEIAKGFVSGLYDERDGEIYKDFRQWCARYRGGKEFRSVPVEVYNALAKVRARWARSSMEKAA